jgi:dTDP-4-dehydrorhamnose reductase
MGNETILIIGSNGQLGSDMVRIAAQGDRRVVGIDYPQIDITDAKGTLHTIIRHSPSVIINCAAYTAVDACESDRASAFALNSEGVAALAHAAVECDAELVHISTDYVFDGNKRGAYTEEDEPNPVSVYGKSKYEGERRLAEIMQRWYIIRIAWLYGVQGENFVKTICRLSRRQAEQNKPLRVVNDQWGSPTWTQQVCNQILRILALDTAYGIYHCTAEGKCTWYDFALRITQRYSLPADIEPCTSEAFPRPAPRPHNSVLENRMVKKRGINSMLRWDTAFEEFAATHKW